MSPKKYDFLVVGAGLFGSVFAEQATKRGFKCCVIDQRPHIGGNCYTEGKDGVTVHTYGPHLFHTSDETVWNYIKQFTHFLPYHHTVKAIAKDQVFSFPINLMTLYQLWGISTPEKALKRLAAEKVEIENPSNLEEWALSQVGHDLYEHFIKGYTAKQWKCDPKELPAFIIKRLPIRTTFNEKYFNDTYQGIPEGGYTPIFKKMLEGVEVKLSIDFFKERSYWKELANELVFTGKIDQFFDYQYGELNYRALRFESKVIETDNYQGIGVINYCDQEIPYTRVVEHKHFDFKCKSSSTVVTWEYPEEWDRSKTPYYPINNSHNNEIYKKYKKLIETDPTVHFGGRLAEYKYYDMHHVIASALAKSKLWLDNYQHQHKKTLP